MRKTLLLLAILSFAVPVLTPAQGRGQTAEARINLGYKEGVDLTVIGHLANNEVSFSNLRGTFFITTLTGEQIKKLNKHYKPPENSRFLALIVTKLEPQPPNLPIEQRRKLEMNFKDTLSGRYQITSGPKGGLLVIKTDPDLLAASVVTAQAEGELAETIVGGLRPGERLGIIAFQVAQ